MESESNQEKEFDIPPTNDIIMRKNIVIISVILLSFYSCSSNKVETERIVLQSQILNDELLTVMPGDLLLVDDCLVWSDPFARDYFLHVHSASTGKELGRMGKVGEGPKEFISPMINRYCVNHQIFAVDVNGKTVGYLSIDSLINGQEPFGKVTDRENEMKMEKMDHELYIKSTDNGSETYFRTIIDGQESFWGVYPIPEMKVHIGGYTSYDPVEGLFVFSSFNFPYLALYKRENSTFTLQWEYKSDKENYIITDDKIIFNRTIKGVRDVCMSRDYIITLERDREKNPIDETTVRRNISKCPRTVFLYDYTGHLLKIVDVGMPVMRIAADRSSNVLYIIGGNPDYVLAKCEL